MLKIKYKKLNFSFVYDRMLDSEYDSDGNVTFQGMSKNVFADKRFDVLPATYLQQPFVIESDTKDVILNIKIQSNAPSIKINPIRATSVYLRNTTQTVLLDLPVAHNYIVVENPVTKETAFTVANTKYYALFLYMFAQEIYNNMHSILIEESNAIYNKYATRLVEPLFSRIYSLLPTVKSLQMLSTRLITKTLVGGACTDLGVSETTAGLTANMPFFSKQNKTTDEIDLVRFPLESYQEFFSGKIAHIWLPSFSFARWQAFQTYVNNIVDYTLEQISEDEIILLNNFGELERHQFNHNQVDFFKIINKYALDIFGKLASNLPINFILPGYPFDMRVTNDHLIGDARPFFDSGTPFDMGIPFDKDQLDSQFTYLNASLVDRNERADLYGNVLAYDSTRFDGTLVYTKGFYAKLFDQESLKVTVDTNEYIYGYLYDGVVVDEDDGYFDPPDSGTATIDDGLFTGSSTGSYDDATF